MSATPETVPDAMPAAMRLLNRERQAVASQDGERGTSAALVPEVTVDSSLCPAEPLPESPLTAVQRTYGAMLTDKAVVAAVKSVLTNKKQAKELLAMFQAVAQVVLAEGQSGPKVSVKFVNRVGRSG